VSGPEAAAGAAGPEPTATRAWNLSGACRFDDLRPFARCWGVALLFHVFAPASRESPALVRLALCLAAARLAAAPDTRRLLLAAAAQLVDFVFTLPATSNHWVLAAFIDLGILAAAGRRVPLTRPAVAPFVIPQLAVAYAFAAFHKLNTGFLDPAASCAAVIARRIPGAPPLGPWGVVVLEAALALAVVPPFTRRAAVAVGVAFHGAVGLAGFYDFSAVMFAAYALLLPPDRPPPPAPERVCGPRVRDLAALVAAAAVFAVSIGPRAPAVGRLLWIPFAVVAPVLFTGLLRRRRGPLTSAVAPARRPAAWILTALNVLNGLCPYLGLKTEGSYAMFSNLRTEGGVSNHLLVPAGAIEVFPFERELAHVESSNDPELAALAGRRTELVLVHLRQLVRRRARPGLSLAFEHRGRRGTIADLRGGSSWSRLADRLLGFRPVAGAGSPCLH
jgi:hypothetical protein